jgi:hypothetical protein
MKTLLQIATLLCASFMMTNGLAQNTPDDLVKKFFSDYSTLGSAKAIDNAYATNPWMTDAGEAIENLKTKLGELTKDFVGEYNGYEPIGIKWLGKAYVTKSYMAKYDRQPIRFTFHFYKPKDKWVLYAFLFDSDISEEMDEAMKLSNLPLQSGQ